MKNHSSNQVSTIICTIPIDSGRGEEDGDFISIEYDNDAYGDTISVDGDVTRWKSNDKRATCTLTLMSTSRSNALLSVLYNADRNTENGSGVGAFLVKDRNSLTTLYAGTHCWIAKPPKIDIGAKPHPVEWKIRIADLEMFVGGN